MSYVTLNEPQAGAFSDAQAATQVADDFQVNAIAGMARDLRGEAVILQQMAQESAADYDDPDAMREAEDARTRAASILATAERIEGEIRNAKSDARSGRKQLSVGRVACLSGELKECSRIVAEEKAQLRTSNAEAVATHTARAVSEPESKPTTTMASIAQRITRVAVAPAAATVAVVHTPATARGIAIAPSMESMEMRVRTVWRQATATLDETVQRVTASEHYQRFVAMRMRVTDSVSAFMESPKEHLAAAVSSTKKAAKEMAHDYVVVPYRKVEHYAIKAYDYVDREAITPAVNLAKAAVKQADAGLEKLVEAKNATIAYVKKPWAEKVADVKNWAGEKKEQLASMLPGGGEKAAPIVAKSEAKPVTALKASAPSATRQAISGLSDKALAMAKWAVEGLTPSAMAKTMSAASISTISMPIVPDISSAIGTFLGAP